MDKFCDVAKTITASRLRDGVDLLIDGNKVCRGEITPVENRSAAPFVTIPQPVLGVGGLAATLHQFGAANRLAVPRPRN